MQTIFFRDLTPAETEQCVPAPVRDIAQRAANQAVQELKLKLPVTVIWMDSTETDSPDCYDRDFDHRAEARPDEPGVIRIRVSEYTEAADVEEDAVRLAAHECLHLQQFQDGTLKADPVHADPNYFSAEQAADRFEVDFAQRFLGAPLNLIRKSSLTGELVGA